MGVATFGNYLRWYDVKAYGATGNGSTDDTAAVQAALTAVITAGGGTLYFPAGTYLCNGAFTDNGTSAPILTTSLVSLNSPTVNVSIVGDLAPPRQYFTYSTPPLGGMSVIKTTRTDTVTGGCLLGGPASSAVSANQNNVCVNLQNLVFACPTNPKFTAVDLKYHQGNSVRDVMIYAGTTQLDQLTQPTLNTSYGITFPEVNHSACNQVDGLNVHGFYSGMRLGELNCGGGYRTWGCYQGVVVPATYHTSCIHDMGTYWGSYHIVSGGSSGADGKGRLRVYLWDIENANGAGGSWQNTVYHVLDASNLLRGDATAMPVSSSIGYDGTILKSGGTGFTVTNTGAP